jgi:exosome complex RNA-binding protein Rrp42 (RNase PH superfamily)
VLRRQDLCITEGRHVWKLCLDIMCLSHEGSLLDAALLAAAAALSNVKLPPTETTKDDEVVLVRGGWMGG